MPDWINIIFKSLGAIIFLFALTRILGKKQIAQLTFFEYVAGITLGELAGFISTDLENHYMYGILALLVWSTVPLLFEFLSLKSKTFRNWTEGKGTVLIKDGKILEDNLKKERYNADELLGQLRQKNAFKVADVEFAVLEPTGELSVMLKKQNQPLTPSHLGIKTGPEQEPQTVIMDGNILNESLATLGLNLNWLHTELDKIGVALENVFLAQVDSYGQLFVDLYDDQIMLPNAQNKQLLLAVLKKCQADLELFQLATRNRESASVYGENAVRVQHLVERLTPYLKR